MANNTETELSIPPEHLPEHLFVAAFPRLGSLPRQTLSYLEWPQPGDKPSLKDLAAAGFFYTGTRDLTRCFQCGGRLADWQPDDDPWEQHALHFPLCAYLALTKGPSYASRINNTVLPEAPDLEPGEISPSPKRRCTSGLTDTGPTALHTWAMESFSLAQKESQPSTPATEPPSSKQDPDSQPMETAMEILLWPYNSGKNKHDSPRRRN